MRNRNAAKRSIVESARTLAGAAITKIVIIESLDADEANTAAIADEYIRGEIVARRIDLPVQVVHCDNKFELFELLNALTEEAVSYDQCPLLHFECHGDNQEGLIFTNGSSASWEETSEALRKLNVATEFNLVSIFSACYGGYFLGQMGIIFPSPCYGIVAPTETVDPGEVIAGLRVFYKIFIGTLDLGLAIHGISNQRLSTGHWFGQAAEDWFENLFNDYITRHCTVSALEDRARRLYRRLLSNGKRIPLGKIKRIIRNEHRFKVLDRYFNIYFMVDEIPGNSARFSGVRKRAESNMKDLRGTKLYVI